MAQVLKATIDTQNPNSKTIGQINAYDNLSIELDIRQKGINISYTSPTFELLALKRDGNRVRQLDNITLVDNKINIVADEQITTTTGIVTLQLVIKDEGRTSTYLFYLTVGRSLDSEIIQSIDKVGVLQDLELYVVKGYEDLKEFEDRITVGEATIRKLNNDMTAAENNRENAEADRNTAFDNLVTSMNNAINAAITTDSTLKDNETARINNYNTLKTDLERIRESLITLNNSIDTEEKKRVQAEIDRAKANIEAINKLNTTNTNVANAEALRVKEWNTIKTENTTLKEALTTINTTANSNEEVRKRNETGRVSAETKRVEDFNNMKTENTVFKDDVNAEFAKFTKDIDNKLQDLGNANIDDTTTSRQTTWSSEKILKEDVKLLDKINNATYLPYEGTNVTAPNSYDGLCKDVVIKGRTLQNLCMENNIGIYTPPNALFFKNKLAFGWKIGVDYTFVFELDNTCAGDVSLRSDGGVINYLPNQINFLKGINIVKLPKTSITKEASSNPVAMIALRSGDNIVNIKNLLLLEGDHTNTPLSELPYVDSVESVGELDGNVISVESVGRNLFYGGLEKGTLDNNGNEIISDTRARSVEYVSLNPNTDYFISASSTETSQPWTCVLLYDCNGYIKYIQNSNGNPNFKFNSENATKCRIRINSKVENVEFIQVEKVPPTQATPKPHAPYISDAKQTQSPIPLRSLPNGVCDTWDMEKGEIIQRVEFTNLAAIKDWTISIEGSSVMVFHSLINKIWMSDSELLCNNIIIGDVLGETCIGVTTTSDRLFLKVKKSELTSLTIDGLNEWLIKKQTYILFKLKTPIIHKVGPLTLRSYDITTHLTSSNYLLPTISAKVPSNVQAIVSGLRVENEKLNKDNEVLKQGQVLLGEGHNVQEIKIEDTESAVNFLLMSSMSAMRNNINTIKEERNMESYLAKQIYKGALSYEEVVAKYPQFKNGIDELLKSYVENDGIIYK